MPFFALGLAVLLAFQPLVATAAETWTSLQASTEKTLSDGLKSLDALDRAGPACSQYYAQSPCPKTKDAVKFSFVKVGRDELTQKLTAVQALRADAKVADQPAQSADLAKVDAQSGALQAAITDANARRAAADHMASVYASVGQALAKRVAELRDSSPAFRALANQCASEASGGASRLLGAFGLTKALIPGSADQAIQKMFTKGDGFPNCPANAASTYTGFVKSLDDLSGRTQQYAARLNETSQSLGRFVASAQAKATASASVAAATPAAPPAKKPPASDVTGTQKPKVDLPNPTSTAAAKKVTAPADPVTPARAPVPEPAPERTAAAAETAPPAEPAPPADNTPAVDTAAAEPAPAPAPEQPVAAAEPPMPAAAPAPAPAPAESAPAASSGSGSALAIGAAGIAGLGAIFLLAGNKGDSSGPSASAVVNDRAPASSAVSSTSTATSTGTATATGTSTSTSTNTGTNTSTGTAVNLAGLHP